MELHRIQGMTVYQTPDSHLHQTGRGCAFIDKNGYACLTDGRWYGQTWEDKIETFCLKHSRRRNNPSLRRKGLVAKIEEEA